MLAEEDEEEQKDILALPVTEESVPVSSRNSGGEAGRTVTESIESAGKLWKGGPVWTVQNVVSEMDEARRTAAAERTAQAGEVLQPPQNGEPVWADLERAARGGIADLALESAGRSGVVWAGLKGLYRQTVGGLRPAAPALPPEQAGRTAPAREPGSAASLAVDEMDRAVRRDSRRYDGGLSIY